MCIGYEGPLVPRSTVLETLKQFDDLVLGKMKKQVSNKDLVD
jgi:hypothetical protein